MQEQETPVIEQVEETQKRPYERPEIIDYGSVRDLTRGAGSKPTFDMMTGTRRKV
ncbi:MAG: lasso RiPP family leader peptide-containing protein [Polyangiaceae bacterium]|nr:lasso RiPP family leader peptide-containing protein [Polyangiaceae bacterium]